MKVLETFIDMKNQNTLKFKLFDIFLLKEAEKEALASQIRIYLSQKKSDIFRAAEVIQYLKLQDNFSFVSYSTNLRTIWISWARTSTLTRVLL